MIPDAATPRWDHKKYERSVLSSYEMDCLPYAIKSALHCTTGIPQCPNNDLCAMCGNAVRLVMQAAEPKIIEAVIKRMAKSVGHGFIDLHPRVSDD